jgi:hypothetical protein
LLLSFRKYFLVLYYFAKPNNILYFLIMNFE